MNPGLAIAHRQQFIQVPAFSLPIEFFNVFEADWVVVLKNQDPNPFDFAQYLPAFFFVNKKGA